MPKPVILPSIEFKSQKAATEAFRLVLHNAPLYKPLPQNDQLLTQQLLARHPEYNMKIGDGLKHIEVRLNTEYGHNTTRGFHIVRLDGTSTDFSYITCITQKSKGLIENLRNACRYAIVPDLLEAKKQAFKTGKAECSVTGKTLDWSQLEIDHTAPYTFATIFNGWLSALKLQSITPTQDWITLPEQGGTTAKFVDEKAEKSWLDYHNEVTKSSKSLRLIEKTAHRSLKNQQLPKIKNPL